MSNVKARILLWGIEGCGKSTTLQTIHAKLRADLRGELRHEPTRLDPTVSYEVLPISLGEIGGVGTQIELVAVPGAPDLSMTRKQLLDEIDGIILVLDASPERIEANFETLAELRESLEAYGRSLDSFPVVLQYNKRDIADPFAIEALHRRIGLAQAAVFETIATTGHGVLATLTTISKHVVRALKGSSASRLHPTAATPSPPPPQAVAAAAPSAGPAASAIDTSDPSSSSDPSGDLELLEIEPELTGALGDEPHDFLEAAILAEGDAEAEAAGFDMLSEAIPETTTTDGVPDEPSAGLSDELSEALLLEPLDADSAEWPADLPDASKTDSPLGSDLRIVSIGQARLEADGGVRLPLVLGDETGQSRSVVLSLRLDALLDGGRD